MPMPELRALLAVVEGYRYRAYDLLRLRDQGSTTTGELVLNGTGSNAFDVLRQWKAGARELIERDAFVRDALRDAFPGRFDNYGFTQAGPIVFMLFYENDDNDALRPDEVADGILVALLHLIAVASCSDGGVVAIDEFENGLHPHAIKSLIGSIRRRAKERNLTVILATHSPTLLNCFKEEPNRVFVIQRSADPQPQALDKLEDPEWLAHFSIGDLYQREEIGAPKPSAAE
jgi:predicted ATPase